MSSVQFRVDGGVAVVTLDRPSEANAISEQVADELLASIRAAEDTADCSVLVLAANGRLFCGGGDVREMASAEDKGAFLFGLATAVHSVMLALRQSRLVIIAAVQGAAAGAGLGLVLNSDLVLASNSATFHSAYNQIGLTPDSGVTLLLPRIVGSQRAARMLVGGYRLDAAEALEWGLVSEVVSPDALESRSREFAATIARTPTQALGPTKKLMNASVHAAYAAHLKNEARMIAQLAGHPDTGLRIDEFARPRR